MTTHMLKVQHYKGVNPCKSIKHLSSWQTVSVMSKGQGLCNPKSTVKSPSWISEAQKARLRVVHTYGQEVAAPSKWNLTQKERCRSKQSYEPEAIEQRWQHQEQIEGTQSQFEQVQKHLGSSLLVWQNESTVASQDGDNQT